MRYINADVIKSMYLTGLLGLRKCLIVLGLFGGGKTRTVMHTLLQLANTKIVYAAPLRKLRDWMYYYARGKCDVYRVRSKIETCPTVSMFVREEDLSSPIEYMYNIIRICSGCRDRALGKCTFLNEVKTFTTANSGLFVMTHNILYVLNLMKPDAFNNTIVVVDEADEYIDMFKFILSEAQMNEIAEMAKRDVIWKKVLARLRSSLLQFGTMYFAKPLVPVAPLLILISATLNLNHVNFIPLKKYYSIYIDCVRSQMIDVCITFPKRLAVAKIVENEKSEYVEREKWIEELVEVTVRIYDMERSVGIACRNYGVNREIYAKLRERGVRCFSDVHQRDPPPFNTSPPYVVLWTTRGRWYRGVSLPDTDVIFCTYQTTKEALVIARGGLTERRHLMSYRAADIGYKYPFLTYSNCASNVQSYFRTNRIRSKRHYIVLLDERAKKAMISVLTTLASSDDEFATWFDTVFMRPVEINSISVIPSLSLFSSS